MKQILTIMKKELYRFFTDRRMVMSLILPAALIYIIYSAIGSATLKHVKDQATYLYKICIVNEPSEKELAFLDSDCPYKIDKVETTSNIDEIKQKIANNEIDLYIKYEDVLVLTGAAFLADVLAAADWVAEETAFPKAFFFSGTLEDFIMFKNLLGYLNFSLLTFFVSVIL